MALPILDGNQSATTLSTILAGGEHTPAHTVVSLGSTAISNITSAVSGSVVSISNFPATQPISGSVSISGTPSVTFGQSSTTFGAVTGSVSVLNFPATQTIAGTVTANVPLLNNTAFYVSGADVDTIRTVIYSSANGDFGDDEGAPVDSEQQQHHSQGIKQPEASGRGGNRDRCLPGNRSDSSLADVSLVRR